MWTFTYDGDHDTSTKYLDGKKRYSSTESFDIDGNRHWGETTNEVVQTLDFDVMPNVHMSLHKYVQHDRARSLIWDKLSRHAILSQINSDTVDLQ